MNTAVAFPQPEIDAINQPYWAGLAEGVLRYQSCACGHRWLPPRAACPQCLGTQWAWATAGGGGRLKSWVVYHVAFHEAFRERLPYNVALVQLDEGPTLITNIEAEASALRAEAALRFKPVRQGDVTVPHFVLI